MVVIATLGTLAFNWLAAVGYVNGVTPAAISDKYPTIITPAGYAFSIWSLIYLGLIAFTVYQVLPAQAERFRNFRTVYILSCVLNCGWIYFWHREAIAVCLLLIVALWASLLMLNIYARDSRNMTETWVVKAPFGIYFGWVTAASLVNTAVLLVYMDSPLGMSSLFGCIMILIAAIIAVIVTLKLRNFMFPLAVAWAVTAIAVKQSGQTAIVVSAVLALVICLIAALSFVMGQKSAARE